MEGQSDSDQDEPVANTTAALETNSKRWHGSSGRGGPEKMEIDIAAMGGRVSGAAPLDVPCPGMQGGPRPTLPDRRLGQPPSHHRSRPPRDCISLFSAPNPRRRSSDKVSATWPRLSDGLASMEMVVVRSSRLRLGWYSMESTWYGIHRRAFSRRRRHRPGVHEPVSQTLHPPP